MGTVIGLALALALLGGACVECSPAPDTFARLESDLTPVGAERAGNADGSIPRWTGGLPVQAIDPAAGYLDPYAQDPVLFTITAANAATYRERLSVGHFALLASHPATFRINVYATWRSAAWPAQVLAEVKQQAPFARTEGERLLDVGKSAVPFPITTDAHEPAGRRPNRQADAVAGRPQGRQRRPWLRPETGARRRCAPGGFKFAPPSPFASLSGCPAGAGPSDARAQPAPCPHVQCRPATPRFCFLSRTRELKAGTAWRWDFLRWGARR